MVRLREEIDREREERNFFQLERDKVASFWDITKQQLEESKAAIRNKERELEDEQEKHQVEIKVANTSQIDSYISILSCMKINKIKLFIVFTSIIDKFMAFLYT